MPKRHKTNIKSLKMDDNERRETEIVANYCIKKSKPQHLLAA